SLLLQLSPSTPPFPDTTLFRSGSTGWQPQHQVLVDASGTPQAALPLYRKSHSYGEYVFDWAWADACHRAGILYYPKLLCAVPFSPVTGARLLGNRELAIELLDLLTTEMAERGQSGLHVNFTEPDDDALLRGRDGWLERIGCQFLWHNRGYRDFQDFLDGFTSRKRKQVRKEREQVVAQGIEFDWREGHQLYVAAWDLDYACFAHSHHIQWSAPSRTR